MGQQEKIFTSLNVMQFLTIGKNLDHKQTASVNSPLKSTEQHDSDVIRSKKSLWIDMEKCDASHDSFMTHMTWKKLPPLCVSASGHRDSLPGFRTHLHSHLHPLSLWWQEAAWRPQARTQMLHSVPDEYYWTLVLL